MEKAALQTLGAHTRHESLAFGASLTVTTKSSGCTVYTLHAHPTKDACDTARGAIDAPAVYIEWAPQSANDADETHFLGFQCAEFALPVRARDPSLQFDFFSRPGFSRPRSVFPLFAFNKRTKSVTLLAPLDAFHDQVLVTRPASNAPGKTRETENETTKESPSALMWGWSGDLDRIPAGFSTSMLMLTGSSPTQLLATWGAMVQERSAIPESLRPGPYADVVTQKLSMWTDNGSAYWYRNEHGMDLPTTLEHTLAILDEQAVPVASVELDSWFYDHEVPREITEVGYCDVVPPTGLTRWEPRHDALGNDGVRGLRARLRDRPLVLHSRHISSSSEYLGSAAVPKRHPVRGDVNGTEENALAKKESPVKSTRTEVNDQGDTWWIDKDRAHPQENDLFYRWMQQAADWGAVTYEQDWLVEIWQGVRQLREEPGRIAAWQKGLNDAAQAYNQSLIWCMATPADMALAASLPRVIAVRTSDDYRYASDPSVLWRWHLTVNCMARSLHLWPFKDVFMSSANESKVVDVDGDPNAELEAALSALSAGPVGIGDRMGRTNRDVVLRTCRSDGVLIKPDVPLAALDVTLAADPACDPLVWADTTCGDWRYILAVNASPRKPANKTTRTKGAGDVDVPSGLDKKSGHGESNESMSHEPTADLAKGEITVADGDRRLVYDWRSRKACVAANVSVSLAPHEWKLFVCCPIQGNDTTVIGDVGTYATMGKRRIRLVRDRVGAVSGVHVLGEPGEKVRLATWAAETGVSLADVVVSPKSWTLVDFAETNGDM